MRTSAPLISAALMTIGLFFISQNAEAHRSGCHRWHSCPSDTGSYVCGDLGYTSGCGGYEEEVEVAPATSQPKVYTPPTPPKPQKPKYATAGIAYVPVGDLVKGLSGATFYKSGSSYVLGVGSKRLTLQLGSKSAKLGSSKFALLGAPYLKENRVFVPVKSLSSVGCGIASMDGYGKTMLIQCSKAGNAEVTYEIW
ncbi:stalk domain-containing protein [Deinococcus cellulosilyticus]|uniref:Copper amine oxidase-like N-terminal domain-containing protein n=1 Tax=Deinococcus cellulosilyticus (strain DSM 18568 / NBRC 106333 / KACC 11606 / 5516J-15) TaxID=1223518 RepID=A0A511NCT5_DEIC1|nr:stalk domain-containing protein [Deinococcus cellulosilyticus]GEM50151.1 hypothetical protein DC3_57860 [Deinococcus cellulosilyticus NBRC 106333 = KACC 11606]